MDYIELQNVVYQHCLNKKWDKGWKAGGCYLHLESSELIEALRGKRSDPVEEGGDVLFALLSLLAHHDISIDDCAKTLIKKICSDEQTTK